MENLYYIKKYTDDLENDHIGHVKSATTDVEIERIEHDKSHTEDTEKDRIEHVKCSTTELINNNDSEKVLLELGKDIGNGDILSAKARLEALEDRKKPDWLKRYHNPDQQGETLLHLTIKSHDDISLVSIVSEMCPDLLLMAREQSPKFYGQTALHMAITKSNKAAIEAMLNVGNRFKKNEMSTLLHIRATGSRFINTVMMGQLPLTVAALTGNTDIVDLLLNFGADLHIQNEDLDTVFHSLVKYAATYPEKVMTIIPMLRHINQKLENQHRIDNSTVAHLGTDMPRQIHSFLWFVRNKENLTPLQLAAKHGVTELFEEILNIKNVYCYISANDGLFDVKEYDITEIDTVSFTKWSQKDKKPKSVPLNYEGIARDVLPSNETNCSLCSSYPETESILEMLFSRDYDSKDAYRIIELPPVQRIIKMKWNKYQKFLMGWMTLHYVFIVLLTMYSVYNVEQSFPSMNGNNITNNVINTFRWSSFVVGTIYGFIVILLMKAKLRKKNMSNYFFHNMEYIVPMLILSVTIIIDVIWSSIEHHDNIPLIIALICGWWLNVFFLSPYQKFSFFTELIKRVITGDLFRFGLVILFGLFSFTAGMYIVFRGTDEEDFSSYGSTMMVMFKLGIGIDDINVLYSSRIPWAAITIFILFTTFTYILMFNALIAMMSQTCSSVSEERFLQWRVQQLSVILLMEDLICVCCLPKIRIPNTATKMKVFGLDPKTRQIKYEDRYFLEILALQLEYATAEDKTRVQRKLNEPEVQRKLTNEGDMVKTRNDLCSSRMFTPPLDPTENSTVDQATPGNDVLDRSVRLKKNTKQISPIPKEEPTTEQKNRFFSTPQKNNFVHEDGKVTDDLDFPKMDPSNSRLILARKPKIGLNKKNERDVECEIRTLTDY